MRHFTATIHDDDSLELKSGESVRYPLIIETADFYGNSIGLQLSLVKATQLRDELSRHLDGGTT